MTKEKVKVTEEALLMDIDCLYNILERLKEVSEIASKKKQGQEPKTDSGHEVYMEALEEYPAIHADIIKRKISEYLSNLASNLRRLADNLPDNRGNVQEVIRDIADSADLGAPNYFLISVADARRKLDNPRDKKATIYTKKDLSDSYSEGFEKGFDRALAKIEDRLTSPKKMRIKSLTIE